MSDIAISVENISKCYRIGTQGGPGYHRLSEMITGVPRALWNASKSLVQQRSPATSTAPDVQNSREFWALKDVSFEIKQGEVVGIIGRNGAGKSTLLKILSRITEPTSGRFGVRGRVASLLEVGTGFHPELTGRENIYVSGITLGMTRAEIKKRFDEIVDFSGVEKFLDTPVKNYSSGMQVRLGFAVAAHLESEILIVDEVLAVGDAAFQTLCAKRIGEISISGRTVLLVSHQLKSLRSIANAILWLDKGKLQDLRPDFSLLDCYVREFSRDQADATFPSDRTRQMALRSVSIRNSAASHAAIEKNDEIYVDLSYEINWPIEGAHVACLVYRDGDLLFTTSDLDTTISRYGIREVGVYNATFKLPTKILAAGLYTVTVTMGIPNVHAIDRHSDVVSFQIVDETTASRIILGDAIPGAIRPICQWVTTSQSVNI